MNNHFDLTKIDVINGEDCTGKGKYPLKYDIEDGTINLDSGEKQEETVQCQMNDVSNSDLCGKPKNNLQQNLKEKAGTRQSKEKRTELHESITELQFKLEQTTQQRDSAVKEKEMMVMRFAVAEKNYLREKSQREAADKKCKESFRENELLSQKIQTMGSEKAKICQILEDKCLEHKMAQQELERVRGDLILLDTKLKWSHNSFKTEMDNHKEAQNKLEALNAKLQEMTNTVEKVKMEAEESIQSYHHSEENRAYILDQRIQEQQAIMILLKHEKIDREDQIKILQNELQRLQSKQNDMLQENNELSLKVQQLERDRSESEQKLSELRGSADQQRQNFADLQTITVKLEQLKLQMKHEQSQLLASNEQMSLFKKRNHELESDMEYCRMRESELLLFTQQLTDKNVRLQSEFTFMENKVQQLICEQALVKRQMKEQETKTNMYTDKLSEEIQRWKIETEEFAKGFKEVSKLNNLYEQQLVDFKGENTLMKRKYEMSLREMNRELHQYRKKLEQYQNLELISSSYSSNSSLNLTGISAKQVIQPEIEIDKQTLIEHIVKLQRLSAKKSEKIDFLEEHINTLMLELQKKSKLLQSYIIREQSGTLTSNKKDSNKAKLAKHNGASLYSPQVVDDNLTLELLLDINRKLQAVLEDALLKNITLQENVDTLGSEVEKLNKIRI